MTEQNQTQEPGAEQAQNQTQPPPQPPEDNPNERRLDKEVEQPKQGPIFAGSVGEGAPVAEVKTIYSGDPAAAMAEPPDPKIAPDGSPIPDNTGATLVSQDPAAALDEPPVNVDVPLAYQDGDRLICTKGNWEGVPTDYTYTWNSSGAPVGSNQDTYTVTPEMVGYTFTCTVTARNAGGSTMATSGEVVVVEPPAAPQTA